MYARVKRGKDCPVCLEYTHIRVEPGGTFQPISRFEYSGGLLACIRLALVSLRRCFLTQVS
jgi:hypothetical protein